MAEEAQDCLFQGKRCMAIGEYQTAVDFLEQACRLYDNLYGVGKRQCADAYLEYGLSLVALANAEQNILNSVGEDDEGEENGDEEEEEDEDGVDDDTTKDAEKENEGTGHQIAHRSTVSNQETETSRQHIQTESHQDVPTSVVNGEAEPTPGTSSGVANKSTSANDGQPKADDDEEDEKEATTMEVAWEVLCLAKRVYMTDESLESQLKLGETLQKLGEISIEWDNNDNAVSILEECLKIRKTILNEDDRLIAVTYYNLGLAHSFKQNTKEANECFTDSMKVIEKRVAQLESQVKLAEQTQDVVAKAEYEKEIQELKELLPEISMRIDEEDEKSGENALKRSREESEAEEAQIKRLCSDTSKPVDDIGHLVRRK